MKPRTLSQDVQRLPIDKIRPRPERHFFNAEGLHELMELLQTYGLLEPIEVRRVQDGFEIIKGERRYRAARLLGWRSIDARIVADF